MPIDDRADLAAGGAVTGPGPVSGYVVGDPHLPERSGTGPWAGVDVSGDALYNLAQVVTLCLRDHADLYLPGDIFDGPDPDPDALYDVYGTLAPLADAGLRVAYILGNHDRGRDWLRPLGAAAQRLDDDVFETRLGTVTGLSFQHPDSFGAEVADVPATDVGLYHQTWVELVRHGRTSFNDLPAHGLAVCGDVHVSRTFRVPEAGTVLSPGTLTPQSVTEFGPARAYGVTGALELVEVPLKARAFLSARAATVAEFDRLIGTLATLAPDPGLPYAIARPFVSVRLEGPLLAAAHAEALRAAARRTDTVIRIDYGRTQDPSARSAAHPQAAGSVSAAVAAAPISDPAKALCRSVLAAKDPSAPLTESRAAAEQVPPCVSPRSI